MKGRLILIHTVPPLLSVFDKLGAKLVCSIVNPDNQPSIGVSQRLHDSSRTFDGANRDMLLFWTEQPST